ncbi:TPR repeat-containing C19B12.01-like protein [Cladobotryum mycophilum]|uniref:TPR repeat-containing C19B12.01-like protein n=1 Tax=Cladobotryum mycophilum TaxID=491253 RepID=A0ABR0SXQ5_9HYPO
MANLNPSNEDETAATTITTTQPSDDVLSSLVGNTVAERLIHSHVSQLVSISKDLSLGSASTSVAFDFQGSSTEDVLAVGLAALDAFLQANVTGPVLPISSSSQVESLFFRAWNTDQDDTKDRSKALQRLRRASLKYLEVDGVSPYAHIPRLELFSLAKYIIIEALSSESKDVVQILSSGTSTQYSLAWTRLRLNTWHYKIITQPSLGPGSNFNKSSQWIDVPSLATQILNGIDHLRGKILDHEVWADEGKETWTREDKALFLVESASNYISLGQYEKAKRALKEAVHTNGFTYALSGALGKRTKFQERDISQLVVIAQSGAEKSQTGADEEEEEEEKEDTKPDALKLNDDTLLEEIHFVKEKQENGSSDKALPPALAKLSPDNQPQLDALDEIILLTEATIKDSFSPADTLTAQEILPFAVRVLTDKSVNWQIYTQALLVRSRIELHRSRTVERAESKDESESDIPAIQVSAPGQETAPVDENKPTTFLPAPKQSESAPAHVRLRYIHALSSPPRWHLESELAYSWAGIGSMASALEVFKRLRLWAEVALCLASSAATEDEDGRGSGGEEKARGIIRWRLFSKTGAESPSSIEPEDEVVGRDVTLLKAAEFSGPERIPLLLMRLGCSHYERAWEISKNRFARAQKSLGEYYIQQKEWQKALEAYKKATHANRMSPDMWGRLGDISLRLGQFEEAAQAFTRSISSATDTAGGEGARTWSNLGSALWSLYLERAADAKDEEKTEEKKDESTNDDEEEDGWDKEEAVSKDPSKLLAQALSAYKRGASISHDNWRIWDNVLTLASRVQPVPVSDIILSLTHIIRIRKTEDAIDNDLISALLQDVVLSKEKTSSDGVYEPPRGSQERLINRLIEEQIVPLITKRPELWALVSRLRSWRRDYAGAIDASERAWRAAVGSSGGGLLPGDSATADWTTDQAGWDNVVKRTDELVSILENWGPDVEAIGQKWRGKARSAVRSVMGRGKENWEGSQGWQTLEGIMEGLKA